MQDKESGHLANFTNSAQAGDLAQLVSPTHKIFLVHLSPGGQLQTHRGVISFDELIGRPWGSEVFSHQGKSFHMLQPSLGDIIRETKRNTQIMYPKDIGYMLITMGIGPGQKIVEAGTGSGALTTAIAWMVGPEGRITSYEVRPQMQRLAQKNLEKLGLSERVNFKLRDVEEGFDETGVDAVIIDLPNPYDYLQHVHHALKTGGYFGTILPTVNQVERLLPALHNHHFGFVEVCEILLRHYKPVYDRLRPTDRMVAHTGYLIFARAIIST